MKQLPLLLAFWLAALTAFGQASILDTLLPRLMRDADIPGLSIAVVKDGQIMYSRAFGVRSADTREPVDAHTVFSAASLSKPLFAFGVMQLVEAGKFDLDRPLYQYLPYDDIAGDDRYKKITARMVLSHSSGFPNWRRGDLEILFPPGERFSYSGEGFVYLQRVIEQVTGKGMEAWMQERVIKPLGMEDSGYEWRQQFDADHAFPHDPFGRSQLVRKMDQANSAYSLQTTADDYARFMLAIIHAEGLKEKTVELMLSSQVRVPKKAFGPSPGLHPHLSWGLGWGLEDLFGSRYFWHWGDNGPFKAFVLASRDRREGVVYFANSSNGLTIMKEVVDATLGPGHTPWEILGYDRYDDPQYGLYRAIITQGYQPAIQSILGPDGMIDTTRISEEQVNMVGYALMQHHHPESARKILKANMEAFPYSANVYDSYAEACLNSGMYEVAARYYARAAELDPGNERAAIIARQLTAASTGNTTFRLESNPNAGRVALAGDFNGWTDWRHLMRWENGAWVVSLDLEPGTYQYKFVVDGVWLLDPANPETSMEGGHRNSVRKVE